MCNRDEDDERRAGPRQAGRQHQSVYAEAGRRLPPLSPQPSFLGLVGSRTCHDDPVHTHASTPATRPQPVRMEGQEGYKTAAMTVCLCATLTSSSQCCRAQRQVNGRRPTGQPPVSTGRQTATPWHNRTMHVNGPRQGIGWLAGWLVGHGTYMMLVKGLTSSPCPLAVGRK